MFQFKQCEPPNSKPDLFKYSAYGFDLPVTSRGSASLLKLFLNEVWSCLIPFGGLFGWY